MKIIIPGGSGQVGTILARAFQQDGHDVVVLSRRAYPAPWRVAVWDAETLGGWKSEIDGAKHCLPVPVDANKRHKISINEGC